MSKEAMKLALEALNNSVDLVVEDAYNAEKLYGNYPTRQGKVGGLKVLAENHKQAIKALEEALAKQEQGEPVAWSDEQMIQFASMVLIQGKHSDSIEMRLETFRGVMVERGTSHPPKQEQCEPIVFKDKNDNIRMTIYASAPIVMTPHPSFRQQRTWVGLTDDDVDEISGSFDYRYDVARATEAKLKEKNT